MRSVCVSALPKSGYERHMKNQAATLNKNDQKCVYVYCSLPALLAAWEGGHVVYKQNS